MNSGQPTREMTFEERVNSKLEAPKMEVEKGKPHKLNKAELKYLEHHMSPELDTQGAADLIMKLRQQIQEMGWIEDQKDSLFHRMHEYIARRIEKLYEGTSATNIIWEVIRPYQLLIAVDAFDMNRLRKELALEVEKEIESFEVASMLTDIAIYLEENDKEPMTKDEIKKLTAEKHKNKGAWDIGNTAHWAYLITKERRVADNENEFLDCIQRIVERFGNLPFPVSRRELDRIEARLHEKEYRGRAYTEEFAHEIAFWLHDQRLDTISLSRRLKLRGVILWPAIEQVNSNLAKAEEVTLSEMEYAQFIKDREYDRIWKEYPQGDFPAEITEEIVDTFTKWVLKHRGSKRESIQESLKKQEIKKQAEEVHNEIDSRLRGRAHQLSSEEEMDQAWQMYNVYMGEGYAGLADEMHTYNAIAEFIVALRAGRAYNLTTFKAVVDETDDVGYYDWEPIAAQANLRFTKINGNMIKEINRRLVEDVKMRAIRRAELLHVLKDYDSRVAEGDAYSTTDEVIWHYTKEVQKKRFLDQAAEDHNRISLLPMETVAIGNLKASEADAENSKAPAALEESVEDDTFPKYFIENVDRQLLAKGYMPLTDEEMEGTVGFHRAYGKHLLFRDSNSEASYFADWALMTFRQQAEATSTDGIIPGTQHVQEPCFNPKHMTNGTTETTIKINKELMKRGERRLMLGEEDALYSEIYDDKTLEIKVNSILERRNNARVMDNSIIGFTRTFTSFSGADVTVVINGKTVGEVQDVSWTRSLKKDEAYPIEGIITMAVFSQDSMIDALSKAENTRLNLIFMNEYGQGAHRHFAGVEVYEESGDVSVDMIIPTMEYKFRAKKTTYKEVTGPVTDELGNYLPQFDK